MSEAHVERAIARLKSAAESAEQIYHKPLVVCYSGGKDSQVLVNLAIKAEIPFVASHSLTTVDAPETVYTVRETFDALRSRGIEATIDRPEMTMWQLIPKKRMPPTRLVRYCCECLKEEKSSNSFIATGVRSDESHQRKSRDTFETIGKTKRESEQFGDAIFLSNDNDERRRTLEHCMSKRKLCVNPILDWTDRQTVDYYWRECEIHNPLYEEGFNRVGCVGCPMGGRKTRLREFERWPRYKAAYLRAFDRMIEARRERGLETKWETADEVFDWWMENKVDPNQMRIELEDE